MGLMTEWDVLLLDEVRSPHLCEYEMGTDNRLP